MDWRILTSTFALIFLAELGDKTQLAALAAAAGSRATWSVFLGAALALVFSTLIAVLAGDALQRVVPLYTIKIAAGCLFIAFGVLLLVSVWREAPAVEPAPAAAGRPGLLSRAAMQAAIAFEDAALQQYERLAAVSGEEMARQVYAWLADEEARHLAHLQGLLDAHGEEPLAAVQLPAEPEPLVALPVSPAPGGEVLQGVIAHERAAAAFFRELARQALLPTLRHGFAALAADEEKHAQRLEALQEV